MRSSLGWQPRLPFFGDPVPTRLASFRLWDLSESGGISFKEMDFTLKKAPRGTRAVRVEPRGFPATKGTWVWTLLEVRSTGGGQFALELPLGVSQQGWEDLRRFGRPLG